MKGIDYASARPNLDEVKAQGFSFVVRYLSTIVGTKTISKVEADDIRSHGLGLALVYEQYVERPKEGRIAGHADAVVALAEARAAGFPDNRPLYFAVDFDAKLVNQPAIDEYLRGVAEVIGLARTGVYGGINLINRCWTNKTATWFWQTGAWSYGEESVYAHFVQMTVWNGTIVGGAKVDINETRQADWGAAWMPIPVKLSIAMQWAIDKGFINAGTSPTRIVDVNFLTWTLYRAKGKL